MPILFKNSAGIAWKNFDKFFLSIGDPFDNKLNDSDKSFEDNGIKVVVDKKSFLYLIGTTLDFSGGLNGKGFVFNNPNADRTCGCGESFSL